MRVCPGKGRRQVRWQRVEPTGRMAEVPGETGRREGTMVITKSRQNEIRRQLRADGAVTRLFVNEVEGEPWIASTYWMSPLRASIASVLIDDSAPGTWEIAANDRGPALVRTDKTPPNLAMVMPDHAKHVELKAAYAFADTVRIHDQNGNPVWTVDGAPLAVNLDYVACVSAGDIGNGSAWRYGAGRVILKGESALKPISVWRELVGTHVTEGKQVSLVLAGIVMPIRVTLK